MRIFQRKKNKNIIIMAVSKARAIMFLCRVGMNTSPWKFKRNYIESDQPHDISSEGVYKLSEGSYIRLKETKEINIEHHLMILKNQYTKKL